jgi:NAD+ kinase
MIRDHEMRLSFLHSGSKKSIEALRRLSEMHTAVEPEEADAIVILGGDGFLLHSIHQLRQLDKPFYGMNCGTVGFLLNEYEPEDLVGRISRALTIELPFLQVSAETTGGDRKTLLAFNELSIVRYSNQSLNLRVYIDGRKQLEKYVGDGLIYATPAGTTAYNLSVRGPILPLTANVLALTPVSPFRPRRWFGAVVPSDTVLEIEVIDPDKRPAGASADFTEIRDLKRLRAMIDPQSRVRLLFDPEQTLHDRIVSEQFYDR